MLGGIGVLLEASVDDVDAWFERAVATAARRGRGRPTLCSAIATAG
jgi:hypothetical protein